MSEINEYFSEFDYTSKTIEELENDYWNEPEFESGLIMLCHKARKKPIKELSEDEIETLIRQKIGLKYLLPIAVKKIEKYLEIITDFYSENLLDTLYNLNNSDWNENENVKERLINILYDSMTDLNEEYKERAEKYLNDNK